MSDDDKDVEDYDKKAELSWALTPINYCPAERRNAC